MQQMSPINPIPTRNVKGVERLQKATKLEDIIAERRNNFFYGKSFYEFIVGLVGNGMSVEDVENLTPMKCAHLIRKNYRESKEDAESNEIQLKLLAKVLGFEMK